MRQQKERAVAGYGTEKSEVADGFSVAEVAEGDFDRPVGNLSSMFSKAPSSSPAPHEVMVECSDAGMEKPATEEASRP